MESEKVKEIKKALEEYSRQYSNFKGAELCKNALTLINDLESENERLKIVVDIANEREYRKKFNDEWRKEHQKELDKQGNGHIAGYPDFDLVYKLYFEQKDRIDELEKESRSAYMMYEKDLATKIEQIKDLKKHNNNLTNLGIEVRRESLKQFAERLKEKFAYSFIFGKKFIVEKDIDETLKEFIK